jgi:hypothetical protein
MAAHVSTEGFDLTLLEEFGSAENALQYLRAKCGYDVAEIMKESFEEAELSNNDQ